MLLLIRRTAQLEQFANPDVSWKIKQQLWQHYKCLCKFVVKVEALVLASVISALSLTQALL